ncbi:glycosyltransferase [Mediterraneibacter glycyrrhizinilyticus]|uniref:glycosyltransferase n=1 Tax=Mediterraneibacter glycyrrhizinilyticus TaxID=342942 RepID=UPI00265A47D9|nr:glycosyltransferase [Mediterraneibacter glycyrrhizinilyticus]MCF2570532.1 glycosyltransferase [Mediterraneibacter glycyrrhizinilyticus]
MKKNILICSHGLDIGGAERALLSMLYNFDYGRFDVDLFLYHHDGIWMNQIPAQVNLLPELPEYAALSVPMQQLIALKQYGVLAGRLVGKIAAAVYDKLHKTSDSAVAIEYSHKYTRRYMPPISPDKNYALAISFLTPHYFVLDNVRADKKIAWIHTDYQALDINIESERKMWESYDYIASISEACTKSFLTKFPKLKNKIILIENTLSEQLTVKQARQNILNEMPKDGTIRLLSIGRFSYPKNFDQIPDICRRIVEGGKDIKWYIIGYGDDTGIVEAIKYNNMGKHVIILGRRDNPYPYIAACDVYVQPSRYEGKAVSVREAQLLHKPVIITNYPTSPSQLIDGYDGFIVPLDNQKCAESIIALLDRPDQLAFVAQNTYQVDYTNKNELEKLYQII